MGKSPAKWFRSVLLGKKGAKSGISKKSAKNKGPLVSSKETASNLSMDLLSLVPETLPASAIQFKEDSNSEKGEAEKLLSDEVVNTSMKQNDNAGSASESTVDLPGDLQKHRLEQAATKAQAAFRGYLARQAFQTLKGVIKLQAAIRGHLVRRQAVSTLYCLQGVVKIQALARGQIVRRSKVKSGMLQKQVLRNQTPGYSKTNASVLAEELRKNALTEKLLRSSPSLMPLHLQYGPGDPNSSHEWLMRWTLAKVWLPEPKDISSSNKKPKIRKGSNHLVLEAGKDKNSPKKMLHHHSSKSVPEHQGNEIEKIRLNLKKISKPIMEKSARSEPNIDRSTESNPKKQPSTDNTSCHELEKPSGAETLFLEGVSMVTAPSVPADLNSLQSHVVTNCSTKEPMKQDDEEEKLPEKLSDPALVTELNDTPVSKTSNDPIAGKSNEDISTTPDEVMNCNGKKNESEGSKNNKQRRASLPLKYDMDGGHGGITPPTQRKLPSYMAPTQSARAKAREQASPRYGQEALESIAVTRRYSMPSLTTGKMSSSPRVQKLVAQAIGKEGIKTDRSLSTSRDGSDKAVRAEWKR